MNLIKFYRIFVKTYKEYNKDKIEAKKCIKDTKAEIILLKQQCEKAKLTLKYLEDLYLMLPREKRREYVQPTIDIFKYGIGCRWNISVVRYLEDFLQHIQFALTEMIIRYNDGEYSTIPEFYQDRVVDYLKKCRIDYLLDRDCSDENKE